MTPPAPALIWSPYLWDDFRAATPDEIDAAERRLGVAFPPSYRDVLGRYQGATPEPAVFDFLQNGHPTDSCVNFLLPVPPHGDESCNLVDENLDDSGQIPPGCIVFAEDPAGNCLAFDYREQTGEPAVVFIDHECVGEKEWVSRVADSFDGFLALLHD